MEGLVWQLYPFPTMERSLKGLYLAHNLRQVSTESGTPFVYSNFITSLDGRIAISHPTRSGLMVPKETANERDWRLYQELATQADIIISSGRYLRDWADGRAQEILQVDDPRFKDLRDWRSERGLPLHPERQGLEPLQRPEVEEAEEGRFDLVETRVLPCLLDAAE